MPVIQCEEVELVKPFLVRGGGLSLALLQGYEPSPVNHSHFPSRAEGVLDQWQFDEQTADQK